MSQSTLWRTLLNSCRCFAPEWASDVAERHLNYWRLGGRFSKVHGWTVGTRWAAFSSCSPAHDW